MQTMNISLPDPLKDFVDHWWGPLAAKPPALEQLRSMYHRPFLDPIQGPAWQLTLHYRSESRCRSRFKITVPGVKVWRRGSSHQQNLSLKIAVYADLRDRTRLTRREYRTVRK